MKIKIHHQFFDCRLCESRSRRRQRCCQVSLFAVKNIYTKKKSSKEINCDSRTFLFYTIQKKKTDFFASLLRSPTSSRNFLSWIFFKFSPVLENCFLFSEKEKRKNSWTCRMNERLLAAEWKWLRTFIQLNKSAGDIKHVIPIVHISHLFWRVWRYFYRGRSMSSVNLVKCCSSHYTHSVPIRRLSKVTQRTHFCVVRRKWESRIRVNERIAALL